jgi:hypothetical protein
MSSPPTSQRATVRPRRSIARVWQTQFLPSVYLASSSRAAIPQVQRSVLVLRQSWSDDGASMPPSRILVLPITTESPSRTFAVPVMSAACASDGKASSDSAIRNFRNMPVRVFRKIAIDPAIVVGFWPPGQRLPND